jgi:hypothetical protein
LSEGQTLDLATLPAQISIRANTNPSVVGSVRFGYDTTPGAFNSNFRVENIVPYALFADNNNGTDYIGFVPTIGSHTLTATPFSASGATGTVGNPLTLHFNVIRSGVPAGPTITSFQLFNADTDASLGTLGDGQTLHLASLPAHLAIRANTSPSPTGSVKFGYDQVAGSFNPNFRIENLLPYALFADNNGDLNGFVPTLGSHTLSATAYTARGATGTAGQTFTIHFTVAAT